MKNFIFIPAILLGLTFMFSGCYTYLAMYDNPKLADVPYEPYIPPTPPPPPNCMDCYWLGPAPSPIIVIINPPDSKPSYERPKGIHDLRNGGEGRNLDNDRRRR